MVRDNLKRRQRTASERVIIAAELLILYEAGARDRQRAAVVAANPNVQLPAILPEAGDKGEARAHAAQAVGVSPRYVQDAKKLKEENSDLYDAVKAGEITLQQARRQEKERKQPARVKETASRATEETTADATEETPSPAAEEQPSLTVEEGKGAAPASPGAGRGDICSLPRDPEKAGKVLYRFYAYEDLVLMVAEVKHLNNECGKRTG